MAHQRTVVHAEHAGIGEHGRAHLLDALVDVEEHDEEHQRDAERDLGPDAEAEPQGEDRRQHHAGQRVDHLHVGIEYRRDGGPPGEPETDQHTRGRANCKGEQRFGERHPQVPPDRAAREQPRQPRRDVARGREEERRQYRDAEIFIGTQDMPQSHRSHCDDDLEQKELGARHEKLLTAL